LDVLDRACVVGELVCSRVGVALHHITCQSKMPLLWLLMLVGLIVYEQLGKLFIAEEVGHLFFVVHERLGLLKALTLSPERVRIWKNLF
jgi:hypothetical protein